jgi:hypothetical protein
MRCDYHDHRDRYMKLARALRGLGRAYQSAVDSARYYNSLIVERLQEG